MKRSKTKLFFGRVLGFPGACVAFLVYGGFAIFGQTSGEFGGWLRNVLLNAIPTIAAAFWFIVLMVLLIFYLT